MADPAAQSLRAEGALIFLQVHPEETQINAVFLCFSDRLYGGLVASPVPGIFYIFIHQGISLLGNRIVILICHCEFTSVNVAISKAPSLGHCDMLLDRVIRSPPLQICIKPAI